LDHGGDCLNEKDKDDQRTADGEQKSAAV
jgi:hypothetical protein